MNALLELKNVSAHYGGIRALSGVDIKINPAEAVALMGANGAGKSTVLKAVYGIAEVDSGEVLWQGVRLAPIVHGMVAKGIVLVPQGRRVFASLTVEENLEVGALAAPGRGDLEARIEDAFGFFPGLAKKRSELAGGLSGGGQQMLAIARGIISSPEILLLDEPSLGLAPKIVREVFEKIKEINLARKTAVVVVEHNIKSLLEFVDRGYVLDKGSVVAEGTSGEITRSGVLERIFTGAAAH